MLDKTQYMLKALLNRFHKDENLLRFLPEKLAGNISNKPKTASVDFPSILSLKNWATPIHYTWFCEAMGELPKQSLPLFLPLFSERQAKGVANILSISSPTSPPSQFSQLYLAFYLKRIMQPSYILPLELIPSSKLNILFNISQKKLFFLIDCLGLYDLSADLKHIVDKQLIAKIQASLSTEQNLFLKECSGRPIKWVSPKMGLAGWNGDSKRLNMLIHGRGLIRLSKAIYEENKSYKWHLVHRFDTSRGKVITKELEAASDTHLISFFKEQVLDIYKRIK